MILMMWSERIGDELYVFFNGTPIYKRWFKTKGPEKGVGKRQNSILLSKKGWPNVWLPK